MNNEYVGTLSNVMDLFKDNVPAEEILSAKLLGEVSAKIVKCRIDMNMNQVEFAQYLGVSQGMVSKWESEDYNFSIKSLAAIATKLNMELSIEMKPLREKGKPAKENIII